MKNLLIASFLIIASLTQVAASIVPVSSSLKVMAVEKSVILDRTGSVAGAESFTIIDAEGNIVFNDKVEKYENKVKFNLSKLPAGNYTIKVSGENFIEIHETVITAQGLSLVSAESHFKPNVTEKEGKLFVNAMLYDEDINVIIYDLKGKLVYDFSNQDSGRFYKTFNLEQLASGNYDVTVLTDYFSATSRISI